MFNLIPKKGWKRVWLKGGFRGASKDFMMNDGIIGTTIINYGYISVLCIPADKKLGSKSMHIIFGISQKGLENMFSVDDAKEILKIYYSINQIVPLR